MPQKSTQTRLAPAVSFHILLIGGYGLFGRKLADKPAFDADRPDLASSIRASRLDAVVHTGGPFQGPGHEVARTCIEAGAHYIDLADAREFVSGITFLHDAAAHAGVLDARRRVRARTIRSHFGGRRRAPGDLAQRGATPCVGLLTLDHFHLAMAGLANTSEITDS